MPKVIRAPAQISEPSRRVRGTIGHYFATKHCPICEKLTLEGVCDHCKEDPQKVVVTLVTRAREDEVTNTEITNVNDCIFSILCSLLSPSSHPLPTPSPHRYVPIVLGA